ncbi:MAG: prepilin peptidase [Gemmatimonadetes bacterium]|nr:prepilin peptidase [Gemmatimonadota bacterium]
MSALFWVVWTALGACVGSFLNVCILRWPVDESVVRPRSRCPRCQRMIRWYENIPVLSWLALRAKCAGCGLPISARYPAIEALVGAGWLAAGLAFGPTFTAIRVAVFGTILLGIAITDLEHYLIPDGFTVSGLIWVLVTAFAALAFNEASPFAGPLDAIVGACAGAGAIAIIGWLGEAALKREAMGFGDVTLMAFAGAALGPLKALMTIFAGAALGAVVFVLIVMPIVRLRGAAPGSATDAAPPAQGAPADDASPTTDHRGVPLVPFGVFLAPAALIVLLWGDQAMAWYLRTMLP